MKIKNLAFDWYEKYKNTLPESKTMYMFPHPKDIIRYDNKFEKEQVKNGRLFIDYRIKIEKSASGLYDSTADRIDEISPIFAAFTGIIEHGLGDYFDLGVLFVLSKKNVHVFVDKDAQTKLDMHNFSVYESKSDSSKYYKEYILSHQYFIDQLKIDKYSNPFFLEIDDISIACPQLTVVEYFAEKIISLTNQIYMDRIENRSIESLKEEANNGDDESQYVLGKKFYTGIEVDLDINQAIHWLKLSTDSFNEDAVKLLEKISNEISNEELYIYLYEYFKDEDDQKRANKYLRKASDIGSEKAKYILGVKYYYGDGVKEDYKAALELLKGLSDTYDTQEMLGTIYYLLKDYDEAIVHLENAANSGSFNCAKILTLCYIDGLGVAKDKQKALFWSNKVKELEK